MFVTLLDVQTKAIATFPYVDASPLYWRNIADRSELMGADKESCILLLEPQMRTKGDDLLRFVIIDCHDYAKHGRKYNETMRFLNDNVDEDVLDMADEALLEWAKDGALELGLDVRMVEISAGDAVH